MYQLPTTTQPLDFPAVFHTTVEGLLAVGGNLHPLTLVNAYAKGIFPWFSEEEPILWWHPYPRAVLFPKNLHMARRMLQILKKTCLDDALRLSADFQGKLEFNQYVVTIDRDFSGVVTACADKRGPGRESTWITKEMKESYQELHATGFAHSFEVWNREQKLVGGIYGIAMGKIFFGESMFSHENNTSKIALFYLCAFLVKNGFLLMDCQIDSPHLRNLGATTIPRKEFLRLLKKGETHLKRPATAFLSRKNNFPSPREAGRGCPEGHWPEGG